MTTLARMPSDWIHSSRAWPVHARHLEVEDHDVEGLAQQEVLRLEAIGGAGWHEALEAQEPR